MQSNTTSATEAPLGKVTLTNTRTKQRSASLHCDAACVDGRRRVLLLSVVGSESMLKALRATLCADTPVEASIELPGQEDDGKPQGGLTRYGCERWEEGYTFHRAKILGGLWHGILVAKAAGFMPALTEEALWQELRSERFSTPVVRAWVPWLLEKLKGSGLADLDCAGCAPGLLVADDKHLDALVAEGLKTKALLIPKE